MEHFGTNRGSTIFEILFFLHLPSSFLLRRSSEMEFTGYRNFVVPRFYVVNTTTFSFPFIFIFGLAEEWKGIEGNGR